VIAIANLALPLVFGLAVLREDVTGTRLAGIAAVLLGTLLVGRAAETARDGRDQPAATRSNRSASPTSSATIAAAGCTEVTSVTDSPA
jgi:hypothetical protein